MGAAQGENRRQLLESIRKRKLTLFRRYDDEERRKPGGRNYTGGQTENEMDGSHQNLDRTTMEELLR